MSDTDNHDKDDEFMMCQTPPRQRDWWKEEWKDMPEFNQDDKESIHSVTVHFETLEDMNAFGELVGKRITFSTKGFFFPVKTSRTQVYIDES